MPSFELKPEHGAVVGTVAASYFVHHFYMAFKVVGARKKYNIEYPALYADEKNCPNEAVRLKFNCTQRAMMNSLESLPSFLALLMTAGVAYPITASSFGLAYLLGRIGYVEGYSTGDPKRRMNYLTGLSYIGLFGLAGTTIKFAVDLLRSK